MAANKMLNAQPAWHHRHAGFCDITRMQGFQPCGPAPHIEQLNKI